MHSQGPCDWELRVDVAGGAPTVVRRAEGTACCVHVLRLRSLDSAPVPSEHEDRSWSGDRTRIGPSRAVSDVWADSRRVRPSVRGLDLDLEATLTRTARPPVVTTVDDVEVGPRLLPEAERLWTAHLARLREANVTSDPDEVPTRLQTATRHRTSVVLDTTHGCDAPAHHIDATGEASVRVEGEVAPVGGTRLSLPTVATWIEGDLDVAATHPMEVSRDTHVHAAPGASALSGLSLETAPGSGVVRGVFTGRGETHLVGGGIELQVACAVVADLGLGDDPGHHAAEAHVATALAHRLRLVVSSHAHHPRGDAGAGTDLGCTCAPAYEVQFGIDPDGAAPTAPHARLHVDGRAFGLTAVSMPGTGDVPVWTVQAETGTDLPRGTTG